MMQDKEDAELQALTVQFLVPVKKDIKTCKRDQISLNHSITFLQLETSSRHSQAEVLTPSDELVT